MEYTTAQGTAQGIFVITNNLFLILDLDKFLILDLNFLFLILINLNTYFQYIMSYQFPPASAPAPAPAPLLPFFLFSCIFFILICVFCLKRKVYKDIRTLSLCLSGSYIEEGRKLPYGLNKKGKGCEPCVHKSNGRKQSNNTIKKDEAIKE